MSLPKVFIVGFAALTAACAVEDPPLNAYRAVSHCVDQGAYPTQPDGPLGSFFSDDTTVDEAIEILAKVYVLTEQDKNNVRDCANGALEAGA